MINDETLQERYLLFKLQQNIFAIEIKYVIEIISFLPITPIPKVPKYLKGVINLRGNIIPVIDLSMKLGGRADDYTERTCMIITQFQDYNIGLIVNQVLEVMPFKEEQISNPINSKEDNFKKFINGIVREQENLIFLLKCSEIVNNNDDDKRGGLYEMD